MKTEDAERNTRQPEEYMYKPDYAPGSRWNGETPKERWFGYGAGDGYKPNNQTTVILGWGSGGSNRTACQTYTRAHPDGQMDGCGWSTPGGGGDGPTPQPSGGSGCPGEH